jgi:putative acetyltransferase
VDERIRPYRAEDAIAVREVHLRAFEGRGEARTVELLHAAGAAPVSLVAVANPDDRVVGHILFSPVQIDECGPDPPLMVGLAPVGVVPEYQGRGIGSRLICKGLEACREAGYGAAAVLGEPGYYSRFGFEQASGKGLGNEYSVDEHFMVAELSKKALDGVSGTVRYRGEFREVSA